MSDRMQRALWAWASGVGTMLVAVAAREKGWAAVELWYVAGLAGVVAMFVKAASSDDAD